MRLPRFDPLRGINTKLRLIILACVAVSVALTGLVFIGREQRRLNAMFGHNLQAIAATAASQLSGPMGDLHARLTDDSALDDVAWAQWREALRSVQRANGLTEDIYTFRGDALLGDLAFVARSYDRPPTHAGTFIGEPYMPDDPSQIEALLTTLSDGRPAHTSIYSDALSDRRWITGYAPIRNSGGVVVGALAVDVDAREHSESLRAEVYGFLLFAGLLIVISWMVGLLLGRKLTRPILRLARAAKALGGGDFEHPIAVKSRDEIGELAETFEIMRKDLKRAQDEALDNMRLSTIGRMASGIIHDFKNPMSAISGYAELMTMADFNDSQKAEFKEGIRKNIDVMVEMTRDLLAYSRGKSNLALASVNARVFIDEVVGSAEHSLASAGMRLCVECEFEAEVHVDQGKIRRVLLNLLTNAREAMDQGGEIHLISREIGGRWVIEVRDNGPGIPDEIRETLFEAFATHGKATGTGLGLALVKQFVEQHGGTVRCESTPGEGTTFCIDIPLAGGSAD